MHRERPHVVRRAARPAPRRTARWRFSTDRRPASGRMGGAGSADRRKSTGAMRWPRDDTDATRAECPVGLAPACSSAGQRRCVGWKWPRWLATHCDSKLRASRTSGAASSGVRAGATGSVVPTVLFLRNAVAYYAGLGIRVERLLTDNAPALRALEFKATCAELGIEHSLTRPCRPQTHGKPESFFRSALRECAAAASRPCPESTRQETSS